MSLCAPFISYLSDYLESHRRQYYDALKEITDTGSWTNWIQFLLEAIVVQAEKNITKTREIINLYETLKKEIVEKTHSQFAIQCLDSLFIKPIFTSNDFKKNAGIPHASVGRLLKTLSENNIIQLVQESSGRRPAVYSFRKLLNIINRQ